MMASPTTDGQGPAAMTAAKPAAKPVAKPAAPNPVAFGYCVVGPVPAGRVACVCLSRPDADRAVIRLPAAAARSARVVGVATVEYAADPATGAPLPGSETNNQRWLVVLPK